MLEIQRQSYLMCSRQCISSTDINKGEVRYGFFYAITRQISNKYNIMNFFFNEYLLKSLACYSYLADIALNENPSLSVSTHNAHIWTCIYWQIACKSFEHRKTSGKNGDQPFLSILIFTSVTVTLRFLSNRLASRRWLDGKDILTRTCLLELCRFEFFPSLVF